MEGTGARTPVALFLHRRPERTRRVFERIAGARPRRLFLIADGPRTPAERPGCEQAREVVARVEWPCEVTRDFAEGNLGLKRRIPSGLDRVFEEVERAVILEDDCLPDPSFFRYCDELLERYANDDRVMHISGSQLLSSLPSRDASYHFSRYVHIWGWATWRRAWRQFDADLRDWHDLERDEREERLRSMFATEDERRYWRYVWDNSGEIENWDAQWSYAVLARNGLAANANRNLISNIGFGEDATNAIEDPFGIAARPLEGMPFPLTHPARVESDPGVDAAASQLFFRRPEPPPTRLPLGRRVWAAILRAGGRALEFVPEPIRPKIRHRDRRPPTS
jgi:hypothetical protein